MLAAVSGGADSTALLLALVDLGADVTAAHYDHRLRPRSAADATHVRRLCRSLGVPLLVGRRREPPSKGSPEAAARRLRLAFLERARLQAGAEVIALGHTADDRAEGVVLHLLRGCGLSGARGMPAARGRIVRPLLAARAQDLRAELKAAGISWLEDPTNADLAQARARVRHHLLPRLEADRPGLTRRLLAAAATAACLQELASARAAALHVGSRAPVAPLAAAPPPVLAEVLRRLFAAAGGPDPGLGRRHLEAMARLVRAPRAGGSLDLPGGLTFRRTSTAVEVAGSFPAPSFVLERRPCAGCTEDAAVHVAPGAHVCGGRRTPGLRLRRRKLQDVLVDAKVPRWDRDHLPLLFVDGKLAWVPGVAKDPELLLPTSAAGLHVEFRSGVGEKVAW